MTNRMLNTKVFSRGGFVAAAIGVIVGASTLMPLAASAEEIVAKLAFHWNPKHHSAKHAIMYADEVNKRAAGKLKIEVFPSGQLFGIREILGGVTSGAVQMGGIVPIVSFPPINKNYNVAAFPQLFSSYQQQRDFFNNDPVGMKVWADITAKTKTTLLMYDPVGPVMTFSGKPLDSLAAMKGLKARALLKSERPRWAAMGANAVSLPTREVYTSLQTGLIDTLNTPPGSVEAYSWWEYLNHAQLPYQFFSDAYVMANTTWFEGLDPELQKILLDVGKEIGAKSTATILETGDKTIAAFKERGGTVVELQGDAKAEFDKMMTDVVVPEMKDLFDEDVLQAAKDFVK